jgi:hypothetical protein
MVQGANETMNEARGALVKRDAFGGTELVADRGELSVSKQQATAIERVRARYVMASKCPRDMMMVRKRLLDECSRPSFARVAWYNVPNKGEGFSARFADAVFRIMGNMDRTKSVIADDDRQRTILVEVIDLETNASESTEIIIPKTVERRKADGREVVARRRKADGKEEIFIVKATADELFTSESSSASKAKRQCTIPMLPGDLQDECREEIRKARSKKEFFDPNIEAKRAADAFDRIGIIPTELAEYLGHPLEQVKTQAQVDALQDLFNAVESGAVNFRELLDEKRGERAAAKADREELQRVADERAEEAKAARAKASPEQDAKPVVVDVAVTQTVPNPARKMNVANLLRDAQSAGLNAEQLRAKLKEFFGEEEPKKVAESDRWLFAKGFLEPDPGIREELDARKAELAAGGKE